MLNKCKIIIQSSRKSLNDRPRLSIAFVLVIVIGCIFLYLNYRHREPIAITYCLEIPNKNNTNPETCGNKKIIHIPAAYFGLIDPKHPNNPYTHLELEVEYPSMRPWSSVSWMDRWAAQKIVIKIVGLANPIKASEFRKIAYPKGSVTLMPETPYALEYYTVVGSAFHVFQPIDKNRLIDIRCGFNADPRANVGCSSSTYISFKHTQIQLPMASKSALFVQYHFKRVLLPDWEDIHEEIASLFESFEIAQ